MLFPVFRYLVLRALLCVPFSAAIKAFYDFEVHRTMRFDLLIWLWIFELRSPVGYEVPVRLWAVKFVV